MAFNYSPKVVTDGLVLYLDAANPRSYISGSTVWNDISRGGNNGTLVNGPTYSSANGGSIVFDGSNDYATFSSSSFLVFGTGDFTLGVWIYPQSFVSYTHMIALPNQSTFVLKATRTGDGDAGTIYVYTPSYTTYGSTPGWTLTLNTWNYVIFKRESSVGYGFLNGVFKGSKSGFTANLTSQILNIHNGYSGEFTQCSMSNVQIYNRALSATEILQNYNALKSRYGLT